MTKKRATSIGVPVKKSPQKHVAGRQNKVSSSAKPRANRKPPPTAVEPDRKHNSDAGSVAKVVRDSFTMPESDYKLIGALKSKCIGMGIAVKKSELLRAGLHALGRISDENLVQVVTAVESIRTGRPPGKKKKKKTNRARGKRR